MLFGMADSCQSFCDCSGSRMDRFAERKSKKWVDSSRIDPGNCAERMEIFHGGISVCAGRLFSVSLSDDGSGGWKACISDRRISGALAGVLCSWTRTAFCITLGSLETCGSRRGESWLRGPVFPPFPVCQDGDENGTDRALCGI